MTPDQRQSAYDELSSLEHALSGHIYAGKGSMRAYLAAVEAELIAWRSNVDYMLNDGDTDVIIHREGAGLRDPVSSLVLTMSRTRKQRDVFKTALEEVVRIGKQSSPDTAIGGGPSCSGQMSRAAKSALGIR